MGCWNQTCAVSNLPIMWDEDVVLLPLIATTSLDGCGMAYYPTDVYAPFGMAIYGKYNDYGGLEEIKTHKVNEDFLLGLDKYQRDKDDELTADDVVKAFNMSTFKDIESISKNLLAIKGKTKLEWNTLEELVEVLTYDGFLIDYKRGNESNNDYRSMTYMMIHKKLYEMMINEVSSRVPYNQTKTYRELYKDKILDYINHLATKKAKYRADLRNAKTEKDKELIEINNMFERYPFNNHAEKLSITSILIPANCYNHIIEYLSEHYDEELMDELLDSIMFKHALSLARKGYLVATGLGSQSGEYQMHLIIANFVKEHTQSVLEKAKEDDEEPYEDKEYLSETMYWWNNN